MSGVSPEQADFGSPFNQIFLIGNPSTKTNLFTNGATPIVQPFGAFCPSGNVSALDGNGFPFSTGTQACFPANLNGANGLAGGTPVPIAAATNDFFNPLRTYQPPKFEMNKRFSHGSLIRFNSR